MGIYSVILTVNKRIMLCQVESKYLLRVAPESHDASRFHLSLWDPPVSIHRSESMAKSDETVLSTVVSWC